jgi:phosphate:Na+ symporter
VLEVIQTLDASTFLGVISCVLIAALITALIHSSSATIGIVMGLGASGILQWETAIAFAVGADLGTTITSWMASLNLSKNAKRAAYAHISFNFIGVTVVMLLFFPAIWLLKTVLGAWGIDPGAAVIIDGQETFPGVPIAVGLFSIVFNIFNVIILFPFVNTFERVLSKVGYTDAEDVEDYSIPRFLNPKVGADLNAALPAVAQEAERHVKAGAVFLDIARGRKGAPADPGEHHAATDILSREIRSFSANLFQDGMSRDQLDLVGSMIEEVDFTSSLSETLYQIARRVKRTPFSPAARKVVDASLERLDGAMNRVLMPGMVPTLPAGHSTEGLIERIVAERASVDRSGIRPVRPADTAPPRRDEPMPGSLAPAE